MSLEYASAYIKTISSCVAKSIISIVNHHILLRLVSWQFYNNIPPKLSRPLLTKTVDLCVDSIQQVGASIVAKEF